MGEGASDWRARLESGAATPEQALAALEAEAHEQGAAARRDTWLLLGDLAGRAHDTPWELAERAAWKLIEAAGQADLARDRRALLLAMGRGFRNLWLMPYVHGRLADDDPEVAEAALLAAGGLGFAGLETACAAFLDQAVPPRLRRAAVRALGRMGAQTAAAALAALADDDDPALAADALTALTEIRSPAAVDAAARALADEAEPERLCAAVRYLAELGRDEVMPALRRLARSERAELRMTAALGARSYKAERHRDAGERLLAALAERDRAVRALLARRLRTLPVAEVLAQAELLMDDDPGAVVQVLGELRTEEVTRFLLAAAARAELGTQVRASALLAVEANEAWEREALAAIALAAGDEGVRVAAVQTVGAFAAAGEVLARLGALAGEPSPALRGALLWALQLSGARGEAAEAVLRRALGDDDPAVRRRAAYVAGNLRARALAGELAELARREEARADLRVAALLALEELADPSSAQALTQLARRENDARALGCAARALGAVVDAAAAAGAKPPDLAGIVPRAQHLLRSADAREREAAARLAGLLAGAVPAAQVAELAADASPRVREEAIVALGRLGASAGATDPAALAALLAALAEAEPDLQARAAEALTACSGRKPLERLLAWVSGDAEAATRARVAARLTVPQSDRAHFRPLVDAALARLAADDPAWEPLVELKLRLAAEAAAGAGAAAGADLEAAIVAAFPAFTELARLDGFAGLARSLRTAEALYRGAASGPADADLSPPIVMWMKCLEGYVHAWLSRRLQALQRQPAELYPYVDRVTGAAWPSYQRFVGERWPDPVDLGGFRVEVPLRALPNALRDLGERRPKRLDSPLSITEWARLMVFFAVDHPTGVKNLFKVAEASADRTVRLAHKLSVLAGARNLATHRQAAGPPVLEAFRRDYYAAFDALTRLA